MAYKDQRLAVRLFLLPEEHKRVRLAAAARGIAMSEFCRRAVVLAAEKVPIVAPPLGTKDSPRKGKK